MRASTEQSGASEPVKAVSAAQLGLFVHRQVPTWGPLGLPFCRGWFTLRVQLTTLALLLPLRSGIAWEALRVPIHYVVNTHSKCLQKKYLVGLSLRPCNPPQLCCLPSLPPLSLNDSPGIISCPTDAAVVESVTTPGVASEAAAAWGGPEQAGGGCAGGGSHVTSLT